MSCLGATIRRATPELIAELEGGPAEFGTALPGYLLRGDGDGTRPEAYPVFPDTFPVVAE